MNISVFETISVSDKIQQVFPGLTQVGLNMVAGNTYRLTFDASITTGILRVYQGTQLIFDTTVNELDGAYDSVHVSEQVALTIVNSFNTYDSVSVSENFSKT